MADQDKLSLHAQIVVKLASDWDPGPVDIIAHSARELIDTIEGLKAYEAQILGGAPAPQQQAPAPEPQQAAPTPTPGPTVAPTAPSPQPSAQPAPSAAATAPQAAATPSATPTAEPAAELTINDVLQPARQLLQAPGGEDKLRDALAACGEGAISTADPKNYAAIKQWIEQALAQ